MSTEAGMSLLEQLKKVPDPRIERTRRHELMDMLVIALCAVICGADNWVDVVQFGKAKRAWFAEFLKLPKMPPTRAVRRLPSPVARICASY